MTLEMECFADQKNIVGKKDKGHHEGKRSEVRRIDAANLQLKQAGIKVKK
jgi:hypothetical protein